MRPGAADVQGLIERISAEIGRVQPGYGTVRCELLREAAHALARLATPAPDGMREAIARCLFEAGRARFGTFCPWEEQPEEGKAPYFRRADALLAPGGPVGALVAERDEARRSLTFMAGEKLRSDQRAVTSEARLAEALKALATIRTWAGNVIFNGEQHPSDHETHLRAWRDVLRRAAACLASQEECDVG